MKSIKIYKDVPCDISSNKRRLPVENIYIFQFYKPFFQGEIKKSIISII